MKCNLTKPCGLLFYFIFFLLRKKERGENPLDYEMWDPKFQFGKKKILFFFFFVFSLVLVGLSIQIFASKNGESQVVVVQTTYGGKAAPI